MGCYRRQKHAAKRRGIEFLLSYDDWWELWKDHWHLRGKDADNYCMCRKGDSGPYELGNVYIDTVFHNTTVRF